MADVVERAVAVVGQPVSTCLPRVSTHTCFSYCTFQRNEPSSLPVLAELVAAANGLSPHEVALQTTYNALKVFAIK